MIGGLLALTTDHRQFKEGRHRSLVPGNVAVLTGRTLVRSNRRYGSHRVKGIERAGGNSGTAEPSGKKARERHGGEGWSELREVRHARKDGAGTSNVAIHDLPESGPSRISPRISVPSTDPTYAAGRSENDRSNCEPRIIHRWPLVARVPERRFSSTPRGMNRNVTFCSPSSRNTHVEPVRFIIYPRVGPHDAGLVDTQESGLPAPGQRPTYQGTSLCIHGYRTDTTARSG